MRATILILLSQFLLISVFSQVNEAVPKNSKLQTPYDAVFYHLDNLQVDNYNPEKAARSMYKDFGLAQRQDAAVKLKQFLDAKGKYINLDIIPRDPNHKDSLKGSNYYQLFRDISEIYLVKKDGQWMYSGFTTTNITEMHSELFPFGSDRLIKNFPTSSSSNFLGLQLWQWVGLVLILLLAFLIFHLLKFIVRFMIRRIIQKRIGVSPETAAVIFKVEKVISFLLILKFIQLMLPSLLLPIEFTRYAILILNIFFTVFFILFALLMADVLMVYFRMIAEKTENTLDDQLIPVVSKLVKSVILITGIFYILKLANVNVTALIAGISISGLALALAAQDTVKNMIGSVMIFFDKPFEIGDWISFDGKDGIVEEVGMRSTRIRSFANSLIYVPNGKLADAVVNNMGLRKYRRFKTELTITYDTPPELIDAFIQGVREIIASHPTTLDENYYVYLNSFGSSSLNILVYTFFNVADWKDELEGKHEIMQAIIKLADLLGVRFAFPTQTLHIEDMPGQMTLSPTYDKAKDSVDQKLGKFMDEYKSTIDKTDQ